MRFFLMVGLLASLIVAPGCQRQPTAPAVDYSVGEVEQLRDEMKRTDWE